MTEEQYKDQVMNELLLVAQNPNSTLEDVKATLGGVWHAAQARGDEETMQFAVIVLDNVEGLVKVADRAMTIAAAAKQAAAELAQQRDAITTEFAELKQAITEVDLANPSVKDLYDGLVSDASDEAYEDAHEMLVSGWEQGNDFAYMIANGFLEGIVEEDTAYKLWGYFDGSELTEDETKELGTWINSFVGKVSKRLDAVHEAHRAKYANDLKEWHTNRAKGA